MELVLFRRHFEEAHQTTGMCTTSGVYSKKLKRRLGDRLILFTSTRPLLLPLTYSLKRPVYRQEAVVATWQPSLWFHPFYRCSLALVGGFNNVTDL